MKHIAWWCIRHDLLFDHPLFRRVILNAIYKPRVPRDSGPDGISGWYDLGPNMSPEAVNRFRLWLWNGDK